MSTTIGNSTVNRDQFLQLFVKEVQNQNPLEPMNNTEFMNQVSMFTLVEQSTQQTANFERMLASTEKSLELTRFNQATSFIGSKVTFMDAASGCSAEGIVDGVIQKDSDVYLEIGDQLVLPTAVTAVRSA